MEVKDIMTALAPQFPDNALRDVCIELATERTSTTAYGTKRNQAIALLASHIIDLTSPTGIYAGGGAGAIASKREGDLAVAFDTSANSNEDLSQTKYGKLLLGLRKGCISPMFVTGSFAGATEITGLYE